MFRNTHLCIDAYGANQSDMDAVGNMETLLKGINERWFDCEGVMEIVPIAEDGEESINNGVSGIILAPHKHFTCHTFSHRNVLFVDMFNPRITPYYFVAHYLEEAYHPGMMVQCRNKEPNGFGRHVMVKIPEALEEDQAHTIIDDIIQMIGMTPLGDRLVDKNESGYDVMQMITKSHIAVHQINDETYIDVFSCKDFPRELVLDHCLGKYARINSSQVSRGENMKNKVL